MLRQTHFVPPVPLIVATETGMVARTGVSVVTTDSRGSEEQLAQLAAGEQDLAVTAFDNLFTWNQRGVDVRAIAQTERTTPLSVFAQPDISRIDELNGRVFAVDALNNGFALAARVVLSNADVTVSFEEVGGVRERLEALLSGNADATILGPPFDAIGEQRGLSRLASINELIPGYPGQVLVTRSDAIVDRRDELQAYVDVLARAVVLAETMTDDDGVALLLGAGVPEGAAPAMWGSRARTLRLDAVGYEIVAGVRRRLGMLSPPADDLSTMMDPSFTDHAQHS